MPENERIIPSAQPKSVATTTILSDGTEIPRTINILSVVVNHEVNRIPSATIILLDGDPAGESFTISNQDYFVPGKEIEIKAGYRADEETIFKGIVISHAIKIRPEGNVLVIECKDKAVKMTISCKSKYFHDIKDSDLIEQLIDAHGLDKEVEATTAEHKQVVQYNSTDWDMALCRAEVNGLLCFTKEGKVKIAKPDLAGETSLTIQFGATIHDLDAEIDARLQYKTVKGTTWDYSSQESVNDTEAEEPSVPEAGNLDASTLADVIGEDEFRVYHSGKLPENELKSWVDAALLKHRLARIRGKVTTDGTAAIEPGQFIQINGIGERFEGKLYVTGVSQRIKTGNWLTVFQFGINPEWFAQAYQLQQPLAGALLPAIQGLHIGVVTKLEGDPDGEDRIEVRLPVISNDDDGIWCRISTLDAGNERGTFFRPEIGDEVVVGFINNDPRHGVVLGMLHSSSKPAPESPSDANHKKGYVTREKMKITFDDEVKSIHIETPAGNKFLITEEDRKIYLEDQNGNKVTMNEDGIKMESIKDIILKATNDIKAEGVNINIKGSAQAKVEGSGSAELSSGGSTTVKGSIVQIN